MITTRIVASMLLVCATAVPAAATPQIFTEAKKAGVPAKNCQYCHTVATPKKETFKPEQLNDRGQVAGQREGHEEGRDHQGELAQGVSRQEVTQ